MHSVWQGLTKHTINLKYIILCNIVEMCVHFAKFDGLTMHTINYVAYYTSKKYACTLQGLMAWHYIACFLK